MQRILIFLGLAALSVLGNYISFSLFFGVSFIFGSIFAIVAVRILGILPGTIIAIIGGSYTYFLWGHPYAAIIFTCETLIIGLLTRRRVPHIALADAFLLALYRHVLW